MDEYCSEIFLGGTQTHVLYNVCEDSLLAAPLILDLILLTELFERISYKTEEMTDFKRFNNVLSTLGYLCKAPLTDQDTPLVNSLFRQKASIDNLFKVCSGIQPDDNMLLEFRCPTLYK
jgi:myo-inositol-1-phosphate synthase